jgi:hypothetical protein
MKKLLLAISFIAYSTLSIGQSQRLVLMEQFTQASCGPCAIYNPALNALLDANPEKVVSIKYQTNWPGTDPMNTHNPTQVAARVTYYGVNSVPEAELDGNVYSGHTSGITASLINGRYPDPSPFTITVSFTLNANRDSIFGHANITASQSYTGTTLVAHMVVIERNIYFATAPGNNGEKRFESVMKRMLPDQNGTALPSTWNSGDGLDLDYAWPLSNVYDKNQLALVVFVQDNSTKEVLQAGYMQPQIHNDAGVTAITGAAYQCVPDVTPQITIRNYGIDPLTSCDIKYRLDADPEQTIAWTGSVLPNATTTYTLPMMSLTNGSHSFTAYTTNPNASTDLDTNNNRNSRKYNLFLSTVNAPIVENFAAVTFPSNGFVVDNSDNDAYTWVRSTYGFNGGGSAKMNCYNAASGTIDNLIAPKLDFTNAITGAAITFDLAHAQYGVNNTERLKINVSTDCGQSWTAVYNKVDPSLATVTGYVTSAFNPVVANWRHETVSLNAYIGQPELLISVNSTSDYGNNIYIDNINITDGIVSVPLLATKVPVELYPNPANGEAFLNVDLEQSADLIVTIYNSMGAQVGSYKYDSFVSGIIRLDISTFAKGNYVVNVQSENSLVTKRLTISE